MYVKLGQLQISRRKYEKCFKTNDLLITEQKREEYNLIRSKLYRHQTIGSRGQV